MKKTIYLFASLFLAATITSCGSSESNHDDHEEEHAEPICTYSYNEESTEFEWTAYKTSEKKGVPGTFNEIEVTSESSSDPLEVLKSISFTMNTASVETQNEDRNGKVAKHFFETINTEKIEGSIKSLSEDGKAMIEITMNGISVEIDGEYVLNGSAFSFESVIDVSAWNALAGIEALNEVCSELHTGEDGVSKLWTEVKLTLKTKLSKDCE
ncbi:MAG: YceI family protein [Fluviicola sp.]|nr:YceI family protein [Fluviicola sp.]